MKLYHSPWHWVVVVAVLAIALFTLSEVHGQSTGAAAQFEGRPAMAGAQAGTGVMAGPPQGGLGPQSPDQPGGGLVLRRPADQDTASPAPPRDPGVGQPGGGDLKPRHDRDDSTVIRRGRDSGGMQQQGSARSKGKRAAKRTIERARHGIGGID